MRLALSFGNERLGGGASGQHGLRYTDGLAEPRPAWSPAPGAQAKSVRMGLAESKGSVNSY